MFKGTSGVLGVEIAAKRYQVLILGSVPQYQLGLGQLLL